MFDSKGFAVLAVSAADDDADDAAEMCPRYNPASTMGKSVTVERHVNYDTIARPHLDNPSEGR